VGEDDLEAGLLLAYPGLGVGEVAAVAEPDPGRRHGRAAGRPADPRGRWRRDDGPVDPPPHRAPLGPAAEHRRLAEQLHCRAGQSNGVGLGGPILAAGRLPICGLGEAAASHLLLLKRDHL
jgi:hypothetical protein